MIRFLGIILFLACMISGCTNEGERTDSYNYDGIKWSDYSKVFQEEAVLIKEYKGNSDHWLAEYFMYSLGNEDIVHEVLLLKYIGNQSFPTGVITLTSDSATESTSSTFKSPPENGIYFMPMINLDDNVDSNTIIKLLVNIGSISDIVELELASELISN